jgi:YesN/AraC family two-component response regulator
MGKEMKISKAANQYVLNDGTGLVIVFDAVDVYPWCLVLNRKVNFFDGQGNNLSKSVGVSTLMNEAMEEALKQINELGIKVIDESKYSVKSINNKAKTIRQQFEEHRPFIEDCARDGMTMAQIAKRLDVTPIRLANAFKSLDLSINRLRSEGTRL